MLFIASELEKCNYCNDFVVHLYGIILSDNNDLALSLTGDTRMCMCNYYVVFASRKIICGNMYTARTLNINVFSHNDSLRINGTFLLVQNRYPEHHVPINLLCTTAALNPWRGRVQIIVAFDDMSPPHDILLLANIF